MKTGDVVVAKRHKNSKPVRAVVIDMNKETPCIARIGSWGGIREEKLWTGLWFEVKIAE